MESPDTVLDSNKISPIPNLQSGIPKYVPPDQPTGPAFKLRIKKAEFGNSGSKKSFKGRRGSKFDLTAL